MINRHIYHGSHFHSGNASYSRPDISDPEGPMLSDVNGVPALASGYARLAGLDPARVDGRQVFEMVDAGDPHAIAALDAFCRRLATYVFNTQLILDVEAVAIGGGISVRPVFIQTLRRHVAEVFAGCIVKIPVPEIRVCRYFNDANLVGALYHHLDATR